MGDNLKENIRELRKIENKYGLTLFRMGLSHLVDIGHRHLDEDFVSEGIKQIMTEDESNKANGINPIITAEFQCEILRCSAELAQFSIWTLFAYIKKYVEVSI